MNQNEIVMGSMLPMGSCAYYMLKINNSFKKTANFKAVKTNHQWTAKSKVLHQGIRGIILPGCHQIQKLHYHGNESLGSAQHCGHGIKLS